LNCCTGLWEIIDKPGYDIFGQPVKSTSTDSIDCINCQRSISTTRYAQHLEKCMNLGRNQRNSRRLTNYAYMDNLTNKDIVTISSTVPVHVNEEESGDDKDWQHDGKQKLKKKRT